MTIQELLYKLKAKGKLTIKSVWSALGKQKKVLNKSTEKIVDVTESDVADMIEEFENGSDLFHLDTHE